MARGLSSTLNDAMTAERRSPDFLIEIWDIRSTENDATPFKINDVVLFQIGAVATDPPVIVGPRQFAGDVLTIDVTEVAGDYVSQGIAASTIQVRVIDTTGDLDPVENPPTVSEPLNAGRWLRQGNVIVVREGDEAETDQSLWPITFTGKIQGQPSQDRNRTTGRSELVAKAASREVDYLRTLSTSANFVQNTTFATMINSLATLNMGLDLAEIDIVGVGLSLTQFRSTQFVKESPLISIAKILFVEGFMPRFAGNGQLTVTDGIITKGPARVYPTADILLTLRRPQLDFNGTNHVTIKGLDPDLTQIIQQDQELSRASITSGFFSKDAEIGVRWSDDRSQQALDVRMQVLASVGDALFSFGDEDFTAFTLSDGGSVEGEIDVDGGLSGGIALVALVIGSLVFTLNVPDTFVPLSGVVIPTGRTVTVLAVQAICAILGQQARGEYRIIGKPYEYVFKELVSITKKQGILLEDQQEEEIVNHLLNSQLAVDTASQRVYRRERAKQNLRDIRSIHDLKLEPDDIFSIGTGLTERRYMIQSVERTLRRGESTIAALNCFEVTPGVLP